MGKMKTLFCVMLLANAGYTDDALYIYILYIVTCTVYIYIIRHLKRNMTVHHSLLT